MTHESREIIQSWFITCMLDFAVLTVEIINISIFGDVKLYRLV
jgi:hypothetical protein